MGVVCCNGEVGPRTVTMVKIADSNAVDHEFSHYHNGVVPNTITPWNAEEGGAWDPTKRANAVAEGGLPGATVYENGGSKAGNTLRVVTDEETDTLPRKQVSRKAGELYAVLTTNDRGHAHRYSKRVRPSLSALSNGGRGVAASAFSKVFEHPMSLRRRGQHSEERRFRSGKQEGSSACWTQI
jgi:hypothetical protein